VLLKKHTSASIFKKEKKLPFHKKLNYGDNDDNDVKLSTEGVDFSNICVSWQ